MNQSNAEIDDANNQKQGSTRTTANQSHSQMVHVFGDDSAPMEGVKDAMVIDEASHQQICYGAVRYCQLFTYRRVVDLSDQPRSFANLKRLS